MLSSSNFTLKKWVYNGHEIAFARKGEWNFGNDSARNVVIFGVDNSLSSHTDNRKNDILVFSEGDTFGINGSFGAPEKKFIISLSKAKAKFCLSLQYDGDSSYLFVNAKKIYKFKANNKNVNFPNLFCLESISNKCF